jgi:A/G-specific adenine glycosylase
VACSGALALQPSKSKIGFFVEGLLKWHEHKNRSYLVWRNTRNPYYILIAEMMLQKTTAEQVQALVADFWKKYPTPSALADAEPKEVEELIKPLGMQHKRSKIFIDLAKTIAKAHNSVIPSSAEELMALPGVGKYIANSVLCLAYGKDVPIIDTNVVRIIERFFNIKSGEARARNDKELWKFAESIIPEGKSRDFNLSLLDFGAFVCTTRKPRHEMCPVKQTCTFYKNSVQR